MNNTPLIIIGGGGHAKVLIEALRLNGEDILGIVDPSFKAGNYGPYGIKVLGGDEAIFAYGVGSVRIINGVGSLPEYFARKEIFERFSRQGYKFASVIHPSAIIASDVEIGEGVQIMAGVVIQPGCRIGENSIINTNASVDHDCVFGSHVHIAPGATFSGGVSVGRCVHIGTGTTVIQGVKIGEGCVIGAGTVLLKDVAPDTKVLGTYVRKINK